MHQLSDYIYMHELFIGSLSDIKPVIGRSARNKNQSEPLYELKVLLYVNSIVGKPYQYVSDVSDITLYNIV